MTTSATTLRAGSVCAVPVRSSLWGSTVSATSSRTLCKAWSQPRAGRLSIVCDQSGPGASKPFPPGSPPGMSGTEVPLGGNVTTTPLSQKGVPKAQRIAYVCSDCGYVYDLDMPFEEQPDDTYSCPQCSAPKDRFVPTNATLEDSYDVTRNKPASTN